MKNTLLIVLFAGFGLASCKKDHTCKCTISGSSSGTESQVIRDTKNNARDKCDEGDTSGNGQVRQCEIED